jgi:hypothetical protein
MQFDPVCASASDARAAWGHRGDLGGSGGLCHVDGAADCDVVCFPYTIPCSDRFSDTRAEPDLEHYLLFNHPTDLRLSYPRTLLLPNPLSLPCPSFPVPPCGSRTLR